MNRFGFSRRLVAALAFASLALPLALALTAPGRAADDVSETRSVTGFERVRLEGAFTTEVTAGKHGSRVVVSGSRDVVERVTTEVRDGTLVIGMRSSPGLFSRAPKIAITLRTLRGFANEGAGTTKIGGLTGGDVALANDGAGTIVAAGRATGLSISLNGTGKIDTTAVDAGDVTVDNNGVGSVRVRASGSLTMNVNGVGEIRYAGEPSHVESHVNGIGRIGRL